MRMAKIALLVAALGLTTSGASQTVVPVEVFRSVELSNGGQVIVRHGATRRVTVLSGNPRDVRIAVKGQRLVIDNHGHSRNHRRSPEERLRVEVVTPELEAVAVSNGGRLQTDGPFPAQAAIAASVEEGGSIDIRSIAADDVEASVYSGGGILTQARETLTASVKSGGIITYWGEARVRKSVRDGGVVVRGRAAEFDTPLPPLHR